MNRTDQMIAIIRAWAERDNVSPGGLLALVREVSEDATLLGIEFVPAWALERMVDALRKVELLIAA